MSNSKKLVDFTTLNEMLFGEEKYIKEFAQAAIISFEEFKENYTLFLLKKDEVNFRKAGHKIKPVAQMLGIDIILDEYETAKNLIWDDNPDSDLKASCSNMDEILDQVLAELQEVVNN
ncbi:MAG: taurine dioxygenase [Balneolales bacterium]|nr:taurine dioxygenase [Balneolales bacterium]